MPKVLVYGALDPAGHAILDARTDVTTVRVEPFDLDTLFAEIGDAEAIVLRYIPFGADIIEKAVSCKVIARVGVGYDNVDMDALNAAGIPLAVTGDVNSRAVAEHAVAMMLAVAKQFVAYDGAARRGEWSIRESMGAIELDGKDVLVVGFGRIGRRTAELCTAFGMRVSVYDPFLSEADITGAGHAWAADLDAAIARADYITLHIPGGAENVKLLNAARIAAMKPDAVVVNTARGQLVDEDAMAAALREGRIHGAGFDVFNGEPPKADNALLGSERSIVTPHTAGLTRECMERMGVVSARNALGGIDGNLDLTLVVNRGALKL